MSHAHKDEFERIRLEHDVVVSFLTSEVRKSQKAKSSKLPLSKQALQDNLEASIATANDAYALLLIATAEGFMRSYIDSLGIPLGSEPKLSVLIDRCRKEFKKTEPKIPIRTDIAEEVHDLRKQRNEYAHGYGSGRFPSVGRMVTTLGRFFDQLP